MLDKAPEPTLEAQAPKADLYTDIKENVLTEDNKKKAKKGLKIAAIIAGVVVLIDAVSFIIFVIVNGGVPK